MTETAHQSAKSSVENPTLEEVFSRFQGELLGTLFHLVGNEEDARDALQEAFVKCWRHREQLPEIQNLKAWVFRIALNTGRDVRETAWRRRRRPLPEHETLSDGDAPPPETKLERDEQLSRMRRAVRQLRPEEQEVFLLRQNGDMTYEQIGEALGIPTGTVKTRMRMALGRLRTVLKVEA